MAIYHHGTHTDNSWHAGKIDAVRDVVDVGMFQKYRNQVAENAGMVRELLAAGG
jgi:hypothetical protein